MNKKSFIGAFLMFLCLIFTGCTKDSGQKSLERIILNATELSMSVGETYTLTASTVPEDIENIILIWSSSDESIVSVDNGTVTANAAGNASVTVSCGNINASCNISVENAESPSVEKVTVSPDKASVSIGETVTLQATVEPSDIEYELTWSSSNPDVASVDNDGTVTGIAAGDAVIMAEAGGKTGTCSISVTGLPVESISLNTTEITLNEGETYTLSVTVSPEGATYKDITWSSSNETVATVSQSGTVSGIREGNTVITVNVDGFTAECNITVNMLPLSVGSLYYSDGTFSSVLDPEKELIGIVFWTGDITKDDAALAREHPDCTHGLVIATNETDELYINIWQENFSTYGSTIGEWVEENLSQYTSPTTALDGENISRALGYNNTKAFEAFNAAPENSEWIVNPIAAVVKFRENNPTPESTSGWYLPSIKELALLSCGKEDVDVMGMESSDNLNIVDEKLKELGLPRIKDFHGMGGLPVCLCSSTEIEDYSQCISLMGFMGAVSISAKDSNIFKVRPILAF